MPIFLTRAETTYYAQVTTPSTYFYSSPTESDEAKMFIITQSYFVELLQSANDTFYSARYADLYGYVLKDSVKPVKNVPITPFLENITFRIFVPSGGNLRSSPNNNGSINLVYSIPFLDSNFVYYGIINGEEAISKKGTIWYYCKYLTGNLSYFGYIYSPLCDCLTTIPTNIEQVEYLDVAPTFDDETTNTSGEVFEGLSSTTTTIIVIVVSLPCLLFIYLLFKPTKLAEESASENTTTKKHRQKKKIHRLKNSDYFELDDDF
ncbi:MAG: hypothetical protein E7376_02930 [Clostridiales bacterium]|nr:hypothetical protein [Clostridiales bacterium]